MRHTLLLLLLLAGLPLAAQTDSLELRIDRRAVAVGDEQDFFVAIGRFDTIVSIQFSVSWDTEIAEFVSFGTEALPFIAVGDQDAAAGVLRVSWFNQMNTSTTLPDSSRILRIRLRAVGEPGQQTEIEFTNAPLAIQLFRQGDEPNTFDPVALIARPGQLRIPAPFSTTVAAQNETCAGAADGAITLSTTADTTQFTFTWTDENGTVYPGTMPAGLPAGTYTLVVTDQGGNEQFTTTVTVDGAAEPLVLDSTGITANGCTAQSTNTLTTQAAGGRAPYTYQLAGQISATGTFSGLVAGDYELSLTDALGCTVTQTVSVAAAGGFTVTLPDQPQPLCPGATLEVTAETDAEEPVFAWSTGATTATVTLSGGGLYTLTVTDVAGCQVTDSVTVTDGSQLDPQLVTDELDLCPGDTLALEVSGGQTYRWLTDRQTLTNPDAAATFAFPIRDVVYQVEIATDCAADTLEIPVFVYTVTATAGPDTCIGPGIPFQFQARGGIFYEWQPSDPPVSDPIIPNPTVEVARSTDFIVEIRDVNQCTTRDTVTVAVADDPASFVPAINLITPNDDRINDLLEFGPIAKYGANSLTVYSRWGEVVYNKVNYQTDDERFDGTRNGEILPAGTYYYVLSFPAGDIKQALLIVRQSE